MVGTDLWDDVVYRPVGWWWVQTHRSDVVVQTCGMMVGTDPWGGGGAIDLWDDGGTDLWDDGGIDLWDDGGTDLWDDGGTDLRDDGDTTDLWEMMMVGTDLWDDGGADLLQT